VKAGDLLILDFGGRLVGGQGLVEPTARYIHAPVHRLSPQGNCVLHTHMPYATALGMLQNPRLEMAVQSALMFHDDIAYDLNYSGLAYDESEGERLALALGAKSVLLMGNHGALVVGRTLPQAFERLYFLERAAQAQLLAMSTGKPLRLIPDAIVARVCAQMQGGGAVGGFEREELHFDALKRMLDRARMDYAS